MDCLAEFISYENGRENIDKEVEQFQNYCRKLGSMMRYAPPADLAKRIENAFAFHKPFEGTDQLERYQMIRETCKQVAELFILICPNSRELEIAILRLREVAIWANQAIAVNEKLDAFVPEGESIVQPSGPVPGPTLH